MYQTLFDLMKPYIAGQLRHVLTVVAGALIAKGALSSADQGAFVSIASGLVFWSIGAAWSWWQKSGQANSLSLANAAKQVAADKAKRFEDQLAAMKKPVAASVAGGGKQ